MATQILDDYEHTNECRVCKDCFVCCSDELLFDKKFEYALEGYKDGEVQRIKVKECGIEPGDINWENLRVKGYEKWCRWLIFLTIVITVSLLSFAAMIWGNIQITKIPAPTNCTSKFDSTFNTDNTIINELNIDD